MKTMLRMTTSTSAPMPSSHGERYQASSPSSMRSGSASLRGRPQTRPRSSPSGFGCVISDTKTVTTASAMNAMTAPQKLAASSEPRSTQPNEYTSCVMNAPSVPAMRPQNPAHGVVRRQNIAMMNVANSGALKYENSSWK